MLVTNKVNFSL